jgi:thiol-disulfide isomerase/thioredoxin
MNKVFFALILTLITSLSILQAEERFFTFSLTTIDNKTINITETKKGLDFKEFKGKAVLIALFGHRCPPCLREIPEFIKLTNNHKDDLAIVAIEAQNYPTDAVKSFAKEHQINYNVIAGINYGDFISYIEKKAGYNKGIPLPLLISIDKDGEVQAVQAGQLREDELEFLVKDLNE